MKNERMSRKRIVVATALAVAGLGSLSARANNLPSLGGDAEPWKVDVYYENDTRYRDKDKTGHRIGLSKFRNTLQVEADKKVGDGWAVRSILRGTWDGVYRLNKDEYGKDAGSDSAADVRIPNTAGPVAQSIGLFNGAPLSGATNSSVAIPGAQPGDRGAYAVTVRNAVGEAPGGPATLAVLVPPAILLSPADQKVVQGDTAVFGVAAAGDQLSFAWKYNSGALPAPDDPTLALDNVQPPASGEYAVVVSSPLGAVTSAPAQLRVFVPPTVAAAGAPEPQPDGSVRVPLAGDAGYTFAVDTSPDLQDWMRLTNLTSQTGTFDYLDAQAASETNRFYRLRWRP